MASPTLKVEIAFTSEPLDTTPTWVDVTQYVRATSAGGGGVSWSRGKGAEIGPFEAGSCRVTLSNRDRRFDPSHAAGPNFGNLIPGKLLRVTATWAAIDYVQFVGNVTGWPQDFSEQGKDATVTVEAFDAIAWLVSARLETDLLYQYMGTTVGSLKFFLRQADVTRWYDQVGSIGTAGTGFDAVPFVGTARVFPRIRPTIYSLEAGTGQIAGSLAPGLASTAVQFDGSSVWQLNSQYVPAGNWSYSFWVQTTSTASPPQYVLGGDDPSTPSGVVITTVGNVAVADVGVINTFVPAAPVNNGIPHHIVVTAHSVNGVTVYVDGVVSVTPPVAFFATRLNVIGNVSQNPTFTYYNGIVQDVAVFDKALSAAEVETLYNLSRGILLEDTADRVTRYLDDIGWPAAWREITTNPRATVGELVYNGAAVLPKLQEVERSEQGMLFATRAGFVAFRERFYANEVTVGNTVQQIFSDDGGATALPYSTFGFRFNDIDIANDVTVTTPTTWAKSSDAASINANLRQSKKVDTILSTFEQADTMAAGLVAKGKTAKYRVPPIVSYPENNTTRWDEVLSLELGYRVSMEITPMAVGSQNVQEVTLEHIEWSIVDALWTLTIAGSPCFGTAGVAAEVGWFTIGTSLIGGPDVIGY